MPLQMGVAVGHFGMVKIAIDDVMHADAFHDRDGGAIVVHGENDDLLKVDFFKPILNQYCT